MIIYTSLALIVLLTSYVAYFTYQRRHKLTCMTGMMIAMTNSMMLSISLGAILGTFIENKDITIPTIASVILGMIVGYLTGRSVSLMAALDGLTAGIMGGMMGSMLGVMLQPASVDFMIYFIDIIFVLVIMFLLRLIDEESKEKNTETSQFRKPLIANPIMLVVLLAFLGTMVVGKGLIFPAKSEASGQIEPVKFTPASNNIQDIAVTSRGYTPNNIVVEAGNTATINFKPEKGSSCLQTIRSEGLGISAKLKEGSDNYINIKDLKPGTYEYACGMGMYKGTITVK
jgi:plastocyanin